MAVAVAADAVRDAAQGQEAIPVRRERLEDALEGEVGPGARAGRNARRLTS